MSASVCGHARDTEVRSGNIADEAPVAQWIEQPPPKGQVGRSIRLRGAMRAPRRPAAVAARLFSGSRYDASCAFNRRMPNQRSTLHAPGPATAKNRNTKL